MIETVLLILFLIPCIVLFIVDPKNEDYINFRYIFNLVCLIFAGFAFYISLFSKTR